MTERDSKLETSFYNKISFRSITEDDWDICKDWPAFCGEKKENFVATLVYSEKNPNVRGFVVLLSDQIIGLVATKNVPSDVSIWADSIQMYQVLIEPYRTEEHTKFTWAKFHSDMLPNYWTGNTFKLAPQQNRSDPQ